VGIGHTGMKHVVDGTEQFISADIRIHVANTNWSKLWFGTDGIFLNPYASSVEFLALINKGEVNTRTFVYFINLRIVDGVWVKFFIAFLFFSYL